MGNVVAAGGWREAVARGGAGCETGRAARSRVGSIGRLRRPRGGERDRRSRDGGGQRRGRAGEIVRLAVADRRACCRMQNPDALRISGMAEDLALAVYDYTAEFPRDERCGFPPASLPSHTRNAPVTPPRPSLEILARIPTASQHASMNDPP